MPEPKGMPNTFRLFHDSILYIILEYICPPPQRVWRECQGCVEENYPGDEEEKRRESERREEEEEIRNGEGEARKKSRRRNKRRGEKEGENGKKGKEKA